MHLLRFLAPHHDRAIGIVMLVAEVGLELRLELVEQAAQLVVVWNSTLLPGTDIDTLKRPGPAGAQLAVMLAMLAWA